MSLSLPWFGPRRKRPVPTDLQILEAIYDRYYEAFVNFEEGRDTRRRTKIYVPTDLVAIAEQLGADPEIVFGRLHYHLQQKYGYRQDDGAEVPFFKTRMFEGDSGKHVVHFPYLASVVASLRADDERQQSTARKATLSLVISWISVVVACMAALINFWK